MASLYRKYRPTNFEEVVGQNHVKITLQNEIKNNSVSHAYLFCGPRAVGKTTFSRVLAKAINCLNRKEGEYEPCNQCQNCVEINKNASLDIIEIDAASHTGVDNVRENIIVSAKISPSKCKFKVFIIDEVHMLSVSAFNALLKILEEPPAHVVFILCTTEVHKIPSTVISRCQRFDFRRIGISDMVKKLKYIVNKEKIEVDQSILESIARQAEGYMRDAESMLGQIIAIGGKKITQKEADLVIPRSDINEILNLLDFLVKKDAAGGIRLVNNLLDSGVNLKSFIDDLIEVSRKIMINKVNPSLAESLSLEFGDNVELKINAITQNLSLERVINFIEEFAEVNNKIKKAFIVQLPLEVAIIELCTLGEVKKKLVNDSPVVNQIDASNILGTSNQEVKSTQQTIERVENINQDLSIDRDKILARWNEVLTKIKKYNHSLSFILKACQPTSLNDNQVCLSFKYKFHKDRVSDQQIKNIIEKVLYEVYNVRLTIKAIVDEGVEVINTPQDDNIDSSKNDSINKDVESSSAIDNLLKTFGGKIVK